MLAEPDSHGQSFLKPIDGRHRPALGLPQALTHTAAVR
jgi:hypothetical protein